MVREHFLRSASFAGYLILFESLTPEELSDIDFKAIMQNRAFRSSIAVLGDLSTSSSYRIDEVVGYFKMLLDLQQQQLVTPDITSDSEESNFELPESPSYAVQHVPVTRRIRLLIQHRVRRFVNGLRTPAFFLKIPHSWVIRNYIWLINVIELAWEHTRYANTAILPSDTYGELCFELLSAFWGNDLEEGYWATLDEQQRIEAGVILIENEADALTLASASRLLNEVHYRAAPFVVAHIVQMADALSLFTAETAERALVYLEQPKHNPVALLQQMNKTKQFFSWDRYLHKLCKKHQLRGARLEGLGFQQGKSLVIDSDKDIANSPNALAVFADWIGVCAEQEPKRQVLQMVWGDQKELLVYNANSMKLSYRLSSTQKPQILSIGKSPSEFAL